MNDMIENIQIFVCDNEEEAARAMASASQNGQLLLPAEKANNGVLDAKRFSAMGNKIAFADKFVVIGVN